MQRNDLPIAIVVAPIKKETTRALVKGLRRSIDQGNVDPNNTDEVNKFIDQFMALLGAVRVNDDGIPPHFFARVAVIAAMALKPLEGGDYGIPDAD